MFKKVFANEFPVGELSALTGELRRTRAMRFLPELELPPPAQQPPCGGSEQRAPGGSVCTPRSATNPGQPEKDAAIKRDFVHMSDSNILCQGPSVKQHFKTNLVNIKKYSNKILIFLIQFSVDPRLEKT